MEIYIRRGISMIEEEMFDEIKQSKGVDEQCLFPKEEWDSLIEWHEVSNLDKIYKGLPEAKEHAEIYERMWLKNRGR